MSYKLNHPLPRLISFGLSSLNNYRLQIKMMNIKTLISGILILSLCACTAKQARKEWLKSAINTPMDEMIELINESNARRSDRKMPRIEYKIIDNLNGEKTFIQGLSLNTCFVYWKVDNENILRSYELKGKC